MSKVPADTPNIDLKLYFPQLQMMPIEELIVVGRGMLEIKFKPAVYTKVAARKEYGLSFFPFQGDVKIHCEYFVAKGRMWGKKQTKTPANA